MNEMISQFQQWYEKQSNWLYLNSSMKRPQASGLVVVLQYLHQYPDLHAVSTWPHLTTTSGE